METEDLIQCFQITLNVQSTTEWWFKACIKQQCFRTISEDSYWLVTNLFDGATGVLKVHDQRKEPFQFDERQKILLSF